MNRQSLPRPFSGFERILLLFGVALLLIYGGARVYTVVFSRMELHRYWQTQSTKSDGKSNDDPVFRLWSKQRIAAYQASLTS